MIDQNRYAQRGFSLIEIMVGVVIGLIAVLVIYQVFAAAEGIKRNTTSVGDAQQNGLLSSFMMGIELANASNGVSYSMTELGTCTATADPATNFRPVPVLITDGAADATPDSFVVNYSMAQRLVATAPFTANAAAGANYVVQSPMGFTAGDLILAISMSGDCAASRVTGVAGPDVNGVVTISHTGAPVGFGTAAQLMNLGPKNSGQRVAYDIFGNVLRSTTLWDDTGAKQNPAVPNPVASNIFNMKLQYGIDNGLGGVTWTTATGQWSAANVMAASISQLSKIRAVRIGFVVQGEQFDKAKYAADLLAPPTWTLFDGTYTGTLTPGFRFRTYEMTIPLRNPIWNPVA
jgi:type IV pilus assembly protein PilW